MIMTGAYRIALLPSADEQAFVRHMTDVVFNNPSALQLTRTTEQFEHQLLKISGDLRQYVWQVKVTLTTDVPYDFTQNAKVQETIMDFGVLFSVEAYTNIEPAA